MSREIKFRVWAKKRKGYRELDQLVFDNQGLEEIWVFPKDDEMQQVYHPSEMVVEQYTGLTDKNGKEIYEGDVVKLDDLGGVTYVDDPVKIVWEDGAFIMKCTKHNQIITDEYGAPWVIGFMVKGIFEVIGNIHEYPELLEDK